MLQKQHRRMVWDLYRLLLGKKHERGLALPRCLHFGAAPGWEPCPTASRSWRAFACTWVMVTAPGGSVGLGLTQVHQGVSYSGYNLSNGEIRSNDTACFLVGFNVPPKAQAYLRSALQLGEPGSFPAAALLF